MVTPFCEFEIPTTDCKLVALYLNEFVNSLQLIDNIRYGEITTSPVPADLTALWVNCDPPDCAIAIVYSSLDDEYTTWAYISGTWRQTGAKSGISSPYFTSFDGDIGLIGDDWVGSWLLDGSGNTSPQITYGSNLLLNPGFENWGGGTPTSWTDVGPAGAEQEAVTVQAGTYSVKFNGVAAPPINTAYQDVVVTEALWFRFSGYSRVGNVASGKITSNWLTKSVSAVGAGWQLVNVVDFSLTTTATMTLGLSATVLAFFGFVDTVSLQQISGTYLYRELLADTGYFYVDYTLDGSDHGGLLLNYVDANNFVLVVGDATNIYVIEVAAGNASLRRTLAYTYVAGARLEVYRYDPEIMDIYYNGALLALGVGFITDTTATKHGVVATSGNIQIHAFGFVPL